MAVMASVGRKAGAMGVSGEKAVVMALRKLPPDYVPEVLRYIEFLDYKTNVARADAAEEAALWAAVEANQVYKRQHTDEGLEVHETGADFLKAVADL
jgi:hypothetical protein